LEKNKGNVLQEEIGIIWKNNIKVDLEEIYWENLDWNLWLLYTGNNIEEH